MNEKRTLRTLIFVVLLVCTILVAPILSVGATVSANSISGQESQVQTVTDSQNQEAQSVDIVAEPAAQAATLAASTTVTPGITYSTHIQNVGWQDYVSDGVTSGTSGKSLRMEAIKINLTNAPAGSSVFYQAHVQNIGWQSQFKDGTMSGTTGQSLRMEAIRISLTGPIADQYDVYYRTHVQNYGWLGWTKNGAPSGSEGFSLRMEAIEIKLVQKGGNAPGSVENSYVSDKKTFSVAYKAHVQNVGWQNAVTDGAIAGTTGRSLRMEALQIYLPDLGSSPYGGGIKYQVFVEGVGWQNQVENGAIAGTTGQSKKIEAIRVWLEGEIAEHYDIYYCTHVSNTGWLGYAVNGQTAGIIGIGRQVEAVKVVVVSKGNTADAPKSSEKPSIEVISEANFTYSGYVDSKGIQTTAMGDGKFLGTENQVYSSFLKLTSLKIDMNATNTGIGGGIRYSIHQQNVGWTSWVNQGTSVGSTNGSLRMEGLKIEMTGEMANYFDVYYRVNTRAYGWLGWAKNGQAAGTTGLSEPIGAIQIRLVLKENGTAPGENKNYSKTLRLGIDVSSYQGDIDWAAAKAGGVSFAILRALQGVNASTISAANVDSKFYANLRYANANGVSVGVYRYGYAVTTEQASAEAKALVDVLKEAKRQGCGSINMPVVYDVEGSAQLAVSKADKAALTKIIKQFKTTIEMNGYSFMLYANRDWLTRYIDMNEFANDKVWVASWYASKYSFTLPPVGMDHGYTGKGNVVMWQFSSQGKVPGISGNVDLDVTML
ncbi:MAG: hypothetical protein LBQ95_03610 [Lachnospiraceae bacterium]|jgi:uncharacterized protein YjdB|nr:hypothetical protein [Lachnospiraceae bacterium]